MEPLRGAAYCRRADAFAYPPRDHLARMAELQERRPALVFGDAASQSEDYLSYRQEEN